ncbi:MAG TPA: FliM/FliN family flagellar motor switch protein [Acidocella sp.]|nr:FliM/FliN family flagellar motor switch protein [Acidocella sp.]
MLDHVQGISLADLFAASRTPQLRSVLMEGLSDRWMRQIRLALFERMRNPVQIQASTNVVDSLDNALAELPHVILAAIVKMTPGDARMLVIIDGDLIGAVVDGMCGATSADPFMRDELSPMELRIGKQMIELTLGAMTEVWSALTPLTLTPVQYETSIGMLAIADGKDWMIVTKGVIETGTGTGAITVVCPYAAFGMLEAKMAQQSGLFGQRAVDAHWENALADLSDDVTVELRLEIARAQVAIGVFEAMQPGQILPCLLLPDAIGVVGDVDLFDADYGQSDGYACCRPKVAGHDEGESAMANENAPNIHDPENNRVELEKLHPLLQTAPAISSKGVIERVPVTLTVELGRTNISVKDLRLLRQGQIVVLDQMVGEPLGIFANGHRVASGEVVSVDKDQYGIRVTALADANEPAKDATS